MLKPRTCDPDTVGPASITAEELERSTVIISSVQDQKKDSRNKPKSIHGNTISSIAGVAAIVMGRVEG